MSVRAEVITGDTLKSLRYSTGLKARAVAERAGLSPQQLSKIEKGERAIEVNEFVAIIKAMGYHAGDFLPNSLGDDTPTYLPLIERLRQTHPADLLHVLAALDSILHALRDNDSRGLATAEHVESANR